MTSSKHHPHLRAILYALGGFLCWVTGDTFIKLAGATGAPKYEIMALGGLSGMISIFTLTALRGELGALRARNYPALAGLGILFLLGYIFFLLGLSQMPLADFYAVVFLAPVLIAGCASIFLGEKLGLKQWLAIAAGFVGVLIAVKPTDLLTGSHSWQSYAAAFAAMLCVVGQMLTMRILGKRESRECMAFYPRLGPVIGGLLGIILLGFVPMPMRTLLYSLAIGGIGGFGWMLIAQAYKMAPVGTIAPFQYSEIVMGSLFGYLIWGDVPALHVVAGAVIIVLSGLYIVRHTKKKSIPLPISEITP